VWQCAPLFNHASSKKENKIIECFGVEGIFKDHPVPIPLPLAGLPPTSSGCTGSHPTCRGTSLQYAAHPLRHPWLGTQRLSKSRLKRERILITCTEVKRRNHCCSTKGVYMDPKIAAHDRPKRTLPPEDPTSTLES